MKRTLLSTSLVLALTGVLAFAQSTATPAAPAPTRNHQHRSHDPQVQAEHLSKKLNLSSDQTAKLVPILSDRQQKMAALRANTSLTSDQRREQIRSIHNDMQTQLSTVLTPDQIQQLNSMRHQHRKHHGSQPEGTAPSAA